MNKVTAIVLTVVVALAVVSLGVQSASAAVTQTVLVKDTLTGKVISGASVSVCDACACYLPKKTDSAGKATFSTSGLRTIDVACSGYVPQSITVTQSAVTYTVSLSRPTPINTVVSRTLARSSDIVPLFRPLFRVTYLGKYSLGQIGFAVGGVALGSKVICLVDPEPTTKAGACTVASVTWIATGGLWLAQAVGVPSTQKFSFYLVTGPLTPTPMLIIVPS
jgi:hypothetical protein